VDGELYLRGRGGERCPEKLERSVVEGIKNQLDETEGQQERTERYERMLCELIISWKGETDFEDTGAVDSGQVCDVKGHIVETEDIDSIQRITTLSKNVMKQPVAKVVEYAAEQSNDRT
jgi:hypothetical protein